MLLVLPQGAVRQERMNLIQTFVKHRLAANLGMLLMILAGAWAVGKITVRLNPVQPMPWVNTSVVWRGASAEDLEKLVTTPLEQQLKTVPEVKTVRSVTRDATALVQIEVEPDADVQEAVDRIKQRIAQIRSFPDDIEPPVVYSLRQLDLVAAVLVTGEGTLTELIALARQMENDLLASGVDVIEFDGLPRQEIAIQVDTRTLFELGLTFDELAQKLAKLSVDAPAGTVGSGQLARHLRSLDQRRDAREFEDLPLTDAAGNLVRLGDIARVEQRALVEEPELSVAGKPTIAMFVRRELASDSLAAAETLNAYLDARRTTLPEGTTLTLFLEAWGFIRDELRLIVVNGATGLILVILALVVFLRLVPAFWVTMGIPATFLAALLGFYYLGGSINAVSLIGFVMALGIVVDDAIVVGEESLTQFDAGKSPVEAAMTGARRMLAPVIASSLTTLCAFIPLVGATDAALQEIALIMLVVIAASLVECFLILPGHLRHAFERVQRKPPSRLRQRFEARFARFREQRFRLLVRLALANRATVVTVSVGLFVVVLLAWTTGWIKTQMGLSIDFDQLRADVRFVAGVDAEERQAFMAHLEEALKATDDALGGGNLVTHMVVAKHANIDNESKNGPQFASILVEMTSPEKRDLSGDEFAAAWRTRVRSSAKVDALAIARDKSWSSDFSILLKGHDADTLKRASDDAIRELRTLDGVSNLRDDLPYGKDQWILSLNTAGRSLGLSTDALGRQLRAAYEGRRIQTFQQGNNELEVRLLLPEEERTDLRRIEQFPIKVSSGEMLPLAAVADLETRRGIDAIRHHQGQRTLRLRGDVDLGKITGREVVTYFNENIRDRLVESYGVGTTLDEISLVEEESLNEGILQFLVALALIYIVLAWVFASWSWPIAVMAAIPLGLTGALLGHVLLGLHINPMSLLGFFTLTGIIVNDSIILVSAYKRLVTEGTAVEKAIEDAVCQRLRPVLLTSLTTFAGLFPLMLEQAPIAAMFKPLAAAICFGLLYGTLLVLVVIPVMLSLVIGGTAKLGSALARLKPQPA